MIVNSKPRVLLVMHNLPAEAVFLTAKFVRLLGETDVHLLVWDSQGNVDAFIRTNNLYAWKDKVHIGLSGRWQVIGHGFRLLRSVVENRKLRKAVFGNKNLKTIIKYLPVFRVKPDIIHFEFGTLATHIKELKELTGAKAIVSFRGYDLNFVGLDNPGYYNNVWEHADALHFLGNDLHKRALKRGYKGDKAEAIIPPAVDIGFFSPIPGKTENTVTQILSVGRLTWKKGYEFAILAMAYLRDKNMPFTYHIAGAGPHRQAIEYIIHENGLQDYVQVHENKSREEIRNMLRSADIFLHPSVSEGFSNAVIEAQACGLPVVCTDADGLPENVADGITGFVVPKWNPGAIADKIEWCIENKDKLKEAGIQGVKRAQERFNIKEQIKAFVQFYKRVHED